MQDPAGEGGNPLNKRQCRRSVEVKVQEFPWKLAEEIPAVSRDRHEKAGPGRECRSDAVLLKIALSTQCVLEEIAFEVRAVSIVKIIFFLLTELDSAVVEQEGRILLIYIQYAEAASVSIHQKITLSVSFLSL